MEDYRFGDEAAVLTAAGRMFAIVALGPGPSGVSLKCDPGRAVDVRGRASLAQPPSLVFAFAQQVTRMCGHLLTCG